jgi:4-alpha-glucanotransferase
LPGTVDEHPNWRRRHPVPAHQILDDQSVSDRASLIRKHRA